MSKWIWLDLDGSIADLYEVNGWLEDLQALRTRPYEIARPMWDMWSLLSALIWAKENGYSIGVISWLSKNPDRDYGERVTKAKIDWLKKYNLDFVLDEILIVPYGQNKANTCRKYGYGILVDDEEPNRRTWDLGKTIDPTAVNLINAILNSVNLMD